MNPTSLEILATVIFALAILHTFSVGYFQRLANTYREGSVRENLFHFLGEVEAVFGIWAGLFVIGYSIIDTFATYDNDHRVVGGAVHYLENLNFTEPAFVFVIMAVASTRPVVWVADVLIAGASRVLPLPRKMAFYVTALTLGPLLGSFITEPAAMTLIALILMEYFYSQKAMSRRFKYATIGLLFVNVSIGGTLTHFAAPPVLMVASKYGWGLEHMFRHFGIKAIVAVVTSTALTAFVFRKELRGNLPTTNRKGNKLIPPLWIVIINLAFLAAVVAMAHHMVIFMGLLLFFLGFVIVTQEYQDAVKLKEALMVAFFLGGLIVLGNMQAWWLKEMFNYLSDMTLYFGATAMTGITDNAALTYLGSLVELSESAKYYLVAGAVTGGGLTVIANAPNPAGYGILKSSFEDEAISPLYLFLGALGPTAIAICSFLLLPV